MYDTFLLVIYLMVGMAFSIMALSDTKHWKWDSIEEIYAGLTMMIGVTIVWPTYAIFLAFKVIREAKNCESTDQGKES